MTQKDLVILKLVQQVFGGTLYTNPRGISELTISSKKELSGIINYFDTYSLMSTKFVNYIKWRKAVLLFLEGKHKTIEGLEEIIQLKNTMNTKLKFDPCRKEIFYEERKQDNYLKTSETNTLSTLS